jgi:putative transposase
MPRQARIVIPDVPHHIIQRGNRRGDIFFSTDDRILYLKWLLEYSQKHKLDILAYCLMTNHLHIVAIPRHENSIRLTLHPLHTRYSMRINKAFNWTGHLLNDRPQTAPMNDQYCWVCVRYVEQNPVTAGIVPVARDYTWSSAAHHCGLRIDPLIAPGNDYSGELDDWTETLIKVPDPEMIEQLRHHTRYGIPCGDRKFLKKIEKITGSEIRIHSKGRPDKYPLSKHN